MGYHLENPPWSHLLTRLKTSARNQGRKLRGSYPHRYSQSKAAAGDAPVVVLSAYIAGTCGKSFMTYGGAMVHHVSVHDGYDGGASLRGHECKRNHQKPGGSTVLHVDMMYHLHRPKPRGTQLGWPMLTCAASWTCCCMVRSCSQPTFGCASALPSP
jgi:hypothetical protein